MNLHNLVSEFIIDLQGAAGNLFSSLTPDSSISAFLPELVLCATILVLLLVRMLRGGELINASLITMVGSALALYFAAPWFHLGLDQAQTAISNPSSAYRMEIFTGMLVYDPFTVFMRTVLIGFTFLFAIFTWLSGIPDREDGADVFSLVLGATLGMCLMASANHLLMVFLAVEMASVPSYVLAGLMKGRRVGSEAALKYSIYGAGAAGVMLYGISLIAGLLNTVHLPTVAVQLAERLPTFESQEFMVLALGGLLIAVGLAFKLSAVPFHFWAPDVFEGASAEIGAFLSVASKAAALALLVRVALGFGTVPVEAKRPGERTLALSQARPTETATVGRGLFAVADPQDAQAPATEPAANQPAAAEPTAEPGTNTEPAAASAAAQPEPASPAAPQPAPAATQPAAAVDQQGVGQVTTSAAQPASQDAHAAGQETHADPHVVQEPPVRSRAIVTQALAPARAFTGKLVAFLAVITCTFGNLAAYGQTNIKRLLAYSTIAHAGYMMMPVSALMVTAGLNNAAAERAIGSLAIYIAVYLFMNLGAFAIVAFLRNAMRSETIADYAGLIRFCPLTVVCFTAILFGLIGLPPLAGFIGKFAIFAVLADGYEVSVQAGQPAFYLIVLLVIGGINTAISLFYYLRIVKTMTMDEPSPDRPPFVFSDVSLQGVYIWLITAPTVLLILNWEGLKRWSEAAAKYLLV